MRTRGPYRIPNNRPYQLGFRIWERAEDERFPAALASAAGFLASPSSAPGTAAIVVPTAVSGNVATMAFDAAVVGALQTGLWIGALQWADQQGLQGEIDFGVVLFGGLAPVAGSPLAPGRTVEVSVASASIDVILLDEGPPGPPSTASQMAISPLLQKALGVSNVDDALSTILGIAQRGASFQ